MTQSKTQSTEALFNGIALFIEESRARIAADNILELSGLDAHVQMLCEEVLLLSQDERLKYADRLQKLLGDLKELGDILVEKRDLVAGEIRSVPQHKKANTAYRIVEASDGYKIKDGE